MKLNSCLIIQWKEKRTRKELLESDSVKGIDDLLLREINCQQYVQSDLIEKEIDK